MKAGNSAEVHAPSYYAATANEAPNRPALFGSATADVCVIGGGFTGLSAALHLAERGLSVIVLESNRVGWGASGRNGGQLHSGQRRDQDWIEAAVGPDEAVFLWRLAEEAKALVKDRIRRHRIDCDLTEGLIHAVHKKRWLDDEYAYVDKLQRVYGYQAVEPLTASELADAIGTDVYYGGSRDREAGHLHPLNFALGLARAAEAAGVKIYEGTRATAFSDASPMQVETVDGDVAADAMVLAGNGYLAGIDAETEARVMPINNFMLATEPLGGRAGALMPDRDAASDSRFVVNYWRLSADGRMLFGGGENYSPKFPADIAAFVRKHMLKIYPQLADARIDYAWGGTLAVTTNRLPYLRRPTPGLYVAAGYSGHGVGIANLAGKVVAEAITGDHGKFDVFARLPNLPFPGGKLLRWPTLALAMTWFALRDRI